MPACTDKPTMNPVEAPTKIPTPAPTNSLASQLSRQRWSQRQIPPMIPLHGQHTKKSTDVPTQHPTPACMDEPTMKPMGVPANGLTPAPTNIPT